ncbi:hypothetical protein D1X54_00430 [Listeria monocytogenes]|nr:hypothetical protein [Listeria monocytogenes]EIM2090926.1 hypothetical protein [Listeria monocytogenes]EIM2258544.1 hypothetical protein [Listeria monocytogenes]ELX6561601.1 hypothetical protein [Listeria monocytogenes]MDD85956.1 hypothetical protein [Listeria monocytogenes]
MALKDKLWKPVDQFRVGDSDELAKIYINTNRNTTYAVAFLTYKENVVRIAIGRRDEIYTYVDTWKAGELNW